MKYIKAKSTSALLGVALLITLTGVVFALAKITRDVPASASITVVAPEGIEIYLDEELTKVANPINFGNVDVDAFGSPVNGLPLIRVWVKNVSLSNIRLDLSDDLDEADVVFVGDEQEPLVGPGETLPGVLTLQDLHPSGGVFSFTLTFGAEGPVPAAPVAQPGEGQTLTVLVTSLGNARFDTWLADGEDLKYLRILDAPLVGGEGGSSIIPGTIKAWDMTPDGKDWTFTVQDDFVKFHNGDTLTVDDVHWTVDKMLGDEARRLEGTGYYQPRDIADATQFQRVDLGPGADQFTVFGHNPRPDIPNWLSENAQGPQGLVQPKAYSLSQVQSGDAGYEGYERNPIGAGPMTLTDWSPGQNYSFERFTDYWWHPGNGFTEDRRVKFEFLEMEVVPDDLTRLAALQSDQADLIEANTLLVDNIQASGDEVAWQDESAYNWVVMIDCWDASMWCFDKRVRQAVEMAVERHDFVDQLYGRGASVTGWGHVTPNSMGYSTELDPPGYDLNAAKALLADAGIVNGIFDGQQVSFTVWTWDAGDTPFLPEVAQHFADTWAADLGFDVNAVVGDPGSVRVAWNNRELGGDILVRTNEARFDGTSITSGGWNNKDVQWRLIEDPDIEPWKSTTTPVVRKALDDLNPATRADSFNEAYRFLKDENHQWSAFNTNLPWGVGPRVKSGSYQPWTLVPYVTAIWTVELE